MIYCAYDTINPTLDFKTKEEVHHCRKWGTYFCNKCASRYDGDRVKTYMNNIPRKEN